MSKLRNLNYFAYLVSLTMITLGVIFAVPTQEDEALTHVHAASTEIQNFSNLQIPRTGVQPFLFKPTLPFMMDRSTTGSTSLDKVETIPAVVGKAEEVKPVPVIVNTNYTITAYYLNVRSESNSDSKILDVLKKGQTVEVVGDSSNKWLEIKTGGFINSAYAEVFTGEIPVIFKLVEKISEVKVDKDTVKVLSYTPEENDTTIKNPVKHGVDSISNLSVNDLTIILGGTALAGIEEAVLEVEKTHHVNALFTIAVARLESANGTSKIAKGKNNLFGLNAIDGDAYRKAFAYDTASDSVYAFGKIIGQRYVEKGRNTLSEINKSYSTSSEWKTKVATIINRDLQSL
jgi:beta-N-acetylglucosaminidase